MTTDNPIVWLCASQWILSFAWLATTILLALFQPTRRRRTVVRDGADEGISIIVPTSAVDNEKTQHDRARAMASLCALDYPKFEIICVVDRGTADDPVPSALRHQLNSMGIRVLVASSQSSPNAKVDAMAAGLEAARHETLLFSDDDVLVDRHHLQHLLAQRRPDVGVVSAAAVGVEPENFWAVLEQAFMNGQFCRLHLAGDAVGYSGILGKTVLTRKKDIVAAGGIFRINGDCCEDAALTRNMRQAARPVALSAQPVLQPVGAPRLADVWSRHRRWLSCRRQYLPWVFACEGVFSSVVTCVAGAIIGQALLGSAIAGAAGTAVLWCALDSMLIALKGWPFGVRGPLAWLCREILFPALWLSALWARTTMWYGRSVPVSSAG